MLLDYLTNIIGKKFKISEIKNDKIILKFLELGIIENKEGFISFSQKSEIFPLFKIEIPIDKDIIKKFTNLNFKCDFCSFFEEENNFCNYRNIKVKPFFPACKFFKKKEIM